MFPALAGVFLTTGPQGSPTTVLSDFMNLTLLGTSCKWNQTVFVCTYCILECIKETL